MPLLLAIDTGNTHTVLGLFQEKKLLKTWRVSTHPVITSDEFRAKLHVLFELEGFKLKDLRAVVVSSVVPTFTAMTRNVFASDIALFIVDHQAPFSFKIAARPAEQVGADRLVNAEAALREYGAPAIIIDSGTATTVCALSEDAYLGGAIMPGIELSIQSLAKNTAKLFAIELVAPEKAIGSNTQEALRSGILLGYASMVDGMVRRFKTELGKPNATVIATGGVSQLLKNLTTEITHFDPDLTLKGLAHLYDTFRAR